MRHIWNLLSTPRERPQMRQRLRKRTLNLGFLRCLANWLSRAIFSPYNFAYERIGTPSSLSSSRPSSSVRAEVVMVTFMPLILSTRV